jgi:hypothetical protein
MTYLVIRVHLASGTEITIAARDDLAVAIDLVETLNRHAGRYRFRVETVAAA